MDSLLIGRLDGSVGVIEITDGYVFNRCELEHCSRESGEFSSKTILSIIHITLHYTITESVHLVNNNIYASLTEDCSKLLIRCDWVFCLLSSVMLRSLHDSGIGALM